MGLVTFNKEILNGKLCFLASLREKCPCSEIVWYAFSCIRTEYGEIRKMFFSFAEKKYLSCESYVTYNLGHNILEIYNIFGQV